MSVISLGGLPGKGKNVMASYLAKKHYKKTNNILRRTVRKILKREIYINNVYSSYPILLNKRKNVYSNRITIYDLNLQYRFKKNSVIIIDEVQAFYDSDEFKDFPKEIAVFNQFHRHFDIENIYYISQHPSRIVKKLRNVICEFYKVRKFFVIPIIKLGVMYYSIYYEFDDYGKWHHPKKEAKTYDVKNGFKIFFVNKVFKAYKSKYLSVLLENAIEYENITFKDLNLSYDDLLEIFKKGCNQFFS